MFETIVLNLLEKFRDRENSRFLDKLKKHDKKTLIKLKKITELRSCHSLEDILNLLPSRKFNQIIEEKIISKNQPKFITNKQIPKQTYMKELLSSKRPTETDENNYLGFEIECIYPIGVSLKELFWRYYKYVNIGTDSSIRIDDTNKYQSAELRICIKQNQIDTVLKHILNKLNSIGAYTNTSCGLHIHIDMRNRNYETCMKRLTEYEDILYSIQPRHRRESTFCVPSWINSNAGHYQAISKSSYSKYKTIEVRFCKGTLEFEYVKNWTSLLTHIVDNQKLPKNIIDWVTEQIKVNE